VLRLKVHYCDAGGVIESKTNCLQKKPQTAQLGNVRGPCVGRGFTVVRPKATHLPHQGRKNEHVAPNRPLTATNSKYFPPGLGKSAGWV